MLGLARKAGLLGTSKTLRIYSLRRAKSGCLSLAEGVLFNQLISEGESDAMS